MGGFFGVVSKFDCVQDLFYGTDYHSHLGTYRGGICVYNNDAFQRFIHNIENAQFRSKFEDDVEKMAGKLGIGCISDTDDQPLIIGSHLGTFAIVTVGKINNTQQLMEDAFTRRTAHFSEMGGKTINPTELVATLIAQGSSFAEGIQNAQKSMDGSCSMLVLTSNGIYAARDRYGRTPVIIGKKKDSYSVTMETCAFPNLDYHLDHELGPGEVCFIANEGIEQKVAPGKELRICTFLWIYYGYPASSYEGINVENSRYRSGANLAKADNVEVDLVCGIPDSGTAHAIGYANQANVRYNRPFVKYTPTWPRSFMPQNQNVRDLVARMKLVPIPELIKDKRLLFCEDSIVRGTQLIQTIERLYESGAKEIHMRPACPPLIFSCKFINFSRSRSVLDLAGRRAIQDIENNNDDEICKGYTDCKSQKYKDMIEWIRKHLKLTSLQYQTLPDMLDAIGMPKNKVCTYCWDAEG